MEEDLDLDLEDVLGAADLLGRRARELLSAPTKARLPASPQTHEEPVTPVRVPPCDSAEARPETVLNSTRPRAREEERPDDYAYP